MSEADARITRILGLIESLWRDHQSSQLGALLSTIADYSKHEELQHVTDIEFEAFLSLYRTGGWQAINLAINEAVAERAKEKERTKVEFENGIDWSRAEDRLARIDPVIEAELEGRLTIGGEEHEYIFDDEGEEPALEALINPCAEEVIDNIDEAPPVEGHTSDSTPTTALQFWQYQTASAANAT